MRQRDGLSGAKRHERVGAERKLAAESARCVFSSVMRSRVVRQAVEVRAVSVREILELLDRPGFVERFGVQLDRRVRGVDARAAAGGFLGVPRMGRAVGAEEELRIAAHRGRDERLAMRFAL